jgi:hypothetical protein
MLESVTTIMAVAFAIGFFASRYIFPDARMRRH